MKTGGLFSHGASAVKLNASYFSEQYYHAKEFALWFSGGATREEAKGLPETMWWIYGGAAGVLLCIGAACWLASMREEPQYALAVTEKTSAHKI